MQDQAPRIPEYDLVAEISKAKGLDGQLVALELGRLSVLCPGLEVWIVPPTREGVRRTMVTEAIDDFKKRGVLIRLEGVNDRTHATELVGRYLLCHEDARQCENSLSFAGLTGESKTSHVNNGFAGQYADQVGAGERQELFVKPDVSGTHFTDAVYGSLGVLHDIKPGPAYEIWVIDGPYGELDIPAVDEYILEESPEQITLSLPKGFIEITTKGKGGAGYAD